MASPATLGADDLRAVMGGYRDALRLHQADINRLNVYPVPDGDTGTNMALTLEAVVSELEALAGGAGLPEVCKAIGHGSLMGARGNSGVILSQLLRGMSERMAGAGDGAVGPDVLVDAIGHASELARRAVVRPVEGTILTVAAAAATGASRGADLLGVVEAARGEAADALARTPEMLPVLAQAGVVDAGGTGYLLLLDAFLHVLDGRALPEPSGVEGPDLSALAAASAAEPGAGESHAVGDLRYEVMYFLHAPDDSVEAFKEVWAGIGDSIVVVGGDGIWNCHIHTNDIGAAIEAGVDAGRPSRIRVTDLDEQVEEERWVRESVGAPGAGPSSEGTGPAPTTSVVAVVSGDGIGRIFRSLGVHHLVVGGQTMNPATADLVKAVESIGVGPDRDPPQQQEHPARGRPGRRIVRQDRARGGDRVDRRGLRRPPGLRPGGRRRGERGLHVRVGRPRGPGRGRRGRCATRRPMPARCTRATSSACHATGWWPSRTTSWCAPACC